MKIQQVQVASFGSMHDRIFNLGPGLNVFYGPNEAGKSTLRSFITLTLFPKSGLKYPALKGSDSGTVKGTLENGDTFEYTRDGKKCSGLGSAVCGIDDREYVPIYSMSPEDLRDVKGLEKGDVRNRFLTIPGGADLPRAYEELNKERLKLLPETKRSSTCTLALLIDTEHELSTKVRKLQARESGDNDYSRLVLRKKELESKLTAAKGELNESDRLRTAAHKADGRADDLQRISELEKREKELLYAENTDSTQLAVLEAEVCRLEDEYRHARSLTESRRAAVGSYNAEALIKNRGRIELLSQNTYKYDILKNKVEGSMKAEPLYESSPGLPVVPIAGGALVVAGIVCAIIVHPIAGIAVTGLGIIIAALGFRKRTKKTVVEYAATETSTEEKDLQYLDNILMDVIKETGGTYLGFHQTVNDLLVALKNAENFDMMDRGTVTAEEKLTASRERVELFLKGYGGRAGFQQAVSDAKELASVRSSLKTLHESTASYEPLSLDADEIEKRYISANEAYTAVEKELSAIDQALRSIKGDTSVEDAITEWSEADSAVYDASYRWARLMLEKIILDKASSEAYGNHRPDVLRRADIYLSSMTDGRYRINTDPRITEISVVDYTEGSVKTVSGCSSGLEDQTKLSIKMAVSQSLSKEKPPFILDDVLLTSDSTRKQGACRSLALMSEEMQILYFTCDRETRDLMESVGASIHEV